jgi:hypothetical protein
MAAYALGATRSLVVTSNAPGHPVGPGVLNALLSSYRVCDTDPPMDHATHLVVLT